MTTNSTAEGKTCVSCGKDVSGQKRMKDSKGQYWCIDCGKADQAKKQSAGSTASLCSGCNESFPAAMLTRWGKKQYCTPCLKKIGGTKGEPASDIMPIVLVIVTLIVVAAIVAYLNFF
jgi:hypothetical protein